HRPRGRGGRRCRRRLPARHPRPLPHRPRVALRRGHAPLPRLPEGPEDDTARREGQHAREVLRHHERRRAQPTGTRGGEGAMKTTAVAAEDLRGVLAVPPLARREGRGRPLDLGESERLVRHMAAGGLTRFLYGGNAFLYHLTLAEYEELLAWLA